MTESLRRGISNDHPIKSERQVGILQALASSIQSKKKKSRFSARLKSRQSLHRFVRFLGRSALRACEGTWRRSLRLCPVERLDLREEPTQTMESVRNFMADTSCADPLLLRVGELPLEGGRREGGRLSDDRRRLPAVDALNPSLQLVLQMQPVNHPDQAVQHTLKSRHTISPAPSNANISLRRLVPGSFSPAVRAASLITENLERNIAFCSQQSLSPEQSLVRFPHHAYVFFAVSFFFFPYMFPSMSPRISSFLFFV